MVVDTRDVVVDTREGKIAMGRGVLSLTFITLVCVLAGSTAPVSAQGNSDNAHWVRDHVDPGGRGSIILLEYPSDFIIIIFRLIKIP